MSHPRLGPIDARDDGTSLNCRNVVGQNCRSFDVHFVAFRSGPLVAAAEGGGDLAAGIAIAATR